MGNKTLNSQFASFYLEAGDLPDDGFAEFDDGLRVLTESAQVMISDGREALMVQKLLPNFAQAGLELQLLAHICVRSHEDDRGHGSYCLKEKTRGVSANVTKTSTTFMLNNPGKKIQQSQVRSTGCFFFC